MSEKTNPFADEQAAIEYTLLWSDLQETLKTHAGITGIQTDPEFEDCDPEMDDMFPQISTKFVLASEPVEDERTLVWGISRAATEPSLREMIGQVTLSIQDYEMTTERYAYELTPSQLVGYYSPGWQPEDGMGKKSRFDRDEIARIRADIQEMTWDPVASEVAARDIMFFDI